MDFTIYTTGSAEFLEIMLNASAMITSSGTSENLARIGMLLGLLILAFTAVFNNQGISFQKAGLVFVLYLMFYGPTATTVIEDTTSGQARVVDNVPVGPAFVGSVISTVAYEIARVSEQAFSTPAMTSYGLFSSLTTLSKVRDALRNPLGLDGFQNYRAAEGWRLHDTYKEFITYCILNPIALRENKNVADLYREASMADMLASPMTNQSIYVYNGPAGGTLMTCSEAQPIIATSLNDVYQDVMNDILNKGFANEKAAGRLVTSNQVEMLADDAIQSFGISGKRAQEFVLTSLISPVFNNSRVDAMNHWQEQRAAMALRESLNHQEIQWAGKGDTFKHYMRPMIAFFEGLLYAMTPFMAFALLLGGPGLSVLGKYLVLPLAIGLWMPLLSIVNAFTLWYAGNQMQVVFDGNGGLSQGFSMLQVMDMDHAIGKALGIGGLLAASVPPLALFIVSGSAMVMNSIMSQMTQGDKFKSEDVMPRSQQSSPVMSTSSMYTADQMTHGLHKTGSTQVAEQITAQQAASALVQSTETASKTATQAYQQNLGSAIQQGATSTQGRQTMAQLGHQLGAQHGLSSNSQYTEAASKLQSLGFSKDEVAAGSFSAFGGVSASFGLGGSRLEQSEQFKKMSSSQQQEAKQAANQLTQAVQSSSTDQTMFATGEAFASSNQNSLSQSTTDSLSKSLTEAKAAQTAYTTASTNQEVFSAGQAMDIKQAAGASLGKGESRVDSAQRLAEMAGATPEGREAFNKAFSSASIQSLSTDREERVAMSAIRAMNQTGQLGNLVGSELSPFDFNIRTGDSGRHAGLAEQAPDTSGLKGMVDSGYASARGAYQGMADMNASGHAALVDDGPVVVDQAHGVAANKVTEADDMHTQRMEAFKQEEPLPQVDVNVNSTTPVVDTLKSFTNISEDNGVILGAKQIAGGAERAWESVKSGEFITSVKDKFVAAADRPRIPNERKPTGIDSE